MNRILVLALCLSASTNAIHAAPRWLQSKILRRVVTAAACAASMADAISTSRAMGLGARERNPLMRSEGRRIGMKIGVCAATVVVGEMARGQSAGVSGMVVGLAGFQLGMYSWATVNNVRVAEGLRDRGRE